MTGNGPPGFGRLTIVALAVVSALLAHPWQTTRERWILGVAVVLLLLALGRRRGRHLSAKLADGIRIWLGRKQIPAPQAALHSTGPDVVTTVLVHVGPGGAELPPDLLAGYLDRFGLRCDSVRVTTRADASGATTWIALTVSGARNLAALQGRSAHIPLRQTAEAAARRLVNELGATGCPATLADPDRVPDLVAGDARERWRWVADERGYLTAYSGEWAADSWEAVLTAAGQTGAAETWTVVEITGTPGQPLMRAGAAVRTLDRPDTEQRLAGLSAVSGRQAGALSALHPLSGVRLVR